MAVVNSPEATVVSGDPAAIAAFAAACEADGIRARVLPVDYASHSAQVGQLEQEILAALDPIAPRTAVIPMVSAMTGQFLAGPEAGPQYWYDSLRAPVEFERAVRVLAGAGHRVFIEASPHPVLTTPITETLGDQQATATVAGTLRRDDGGPARLLASLAQAHVAGAARRLGPGHPGRRPGRAAHLRLPAPALLARGASARDRAVAASGDGATADGNPSAAEARFWAAVESGDLQALTDVLDVDARQPLREVLPVLASWRQRERDELAATSWRYRVSWAPVRPAEPGNAAG